MATLLGEKIKDTYQGLLKLIDNSGVSSTEKEITDGEGASTGVFIANDGRFKASDVIATSGLSNGGTYTDSSGSTGSAGQLLSSDSTSTSWVDAPQGGVTSIVAGTGVTITPADGLGDVTIEASGGGGGGGGGGYSWHQGLDTFAMTTVGKWYNWLGARQMASFYPNFQSGTSAEPTLIGNSNRFYLSNRGPLTSMDFYTPKCQFGNAVVRIFAASYDYNSNKDILVNKQILINDTFPTVSNQAVAKSDWVIPTHTFSPQSVLIIHVKLDSGIEFLSPPTLTWNFES